MRTSAKIAEKGMGMLTVKEYERIPRPLPKSLYAAAGLLRKKNRDLLKHYRTVRREWPSYRSRGDNRARG